MAIKTVFLLEKTYPQTGFKMVFSSLSAAISFANEREECDFTRTELVFYSDINYCQCKKPKKVASLSRNVFCKNCDLLIQRKK